MKILHVITTLSSGGAEKMLVDIIKKMQHNGIMCEVLVLTKKGNFFHKQLSILKIPIHYGKTMNVYSLKNILFIRNIIKGNDYDCIHTHLFASQIFTALAMKSIPTYPTLITTEHNTYNRRREVKLFLKLDKWMYEKYDKIIAISKGTKKSLTLYLPETETKTVIIENGIDLLQYESAIPLDRKLLDRSISIDDKIILMVAAMREQKDHETLIRASRLLPKDFRVVFVGDGERFEEVKGYAQRNGRENIVFLGRRADVPAIMATSDIFVLSSKWEGFGLVVVEAAATGLPVVASDLAGLNEVVNALGGSLFEPGNEHELAERIIDAIYSMDSTSELYDLGKFTIDKTVSSYINLYKDTLKEKGLE